MYKIINKNTNKIIDYSSGSLTKEENKADMLEFSIIPKTELFNNLEQFVSKIEVYEDTTKIFDGRVIEITDGMNSDGMIYYNIVCESVLNYLNDTRVGKWAIHPSNKPVLEEGEEADPTVTIYENMNVTKLLQLILDNHNSKVLADKKIYMGRVTVADSVYCYTGFETSLNAIYEKLVNRKGGFLQIREENNRYYLDYLEELPVSSNKIELTVNMKSVNRKNNLTSICTRLIAVGADGITFESINGDKNYVEATELISKYGVIEQTHEWSDVTIKENLLKKAQEKIKELNKNIYSLEVTALDLSYVDLNYKQFDVSQKVEIINNLAGIKETHRVVSKTINLHDPWNSSLQFSNKPAEVTNNVSHIIQENNDNRIEILMTGNRLIQKVTSLDGRFQTYREQTDKAILERVTDGEFTSYKYQTAQLIASKVSGGEFESYKIQTANQIASKVSGGEFESFKNQTATEISQTVKKGNLISTINQSAEGIQISASKVELNGLVSFSDLSNPGQTVISGSNIKTGTIESIELKGNKITGGTIYGTSIDSASLSGSNLTVGDIETQQLKSRGEAYLFQGLTVNLNATFNQNVGIKGNLSVDGTKPVIVTTPTYGKVALTSMDATECLFTDFGTNTTVNGLCKINIDNVFKETVTIDKNNNYRIFLSKYSKGDIWIHEKTNNYFVVASDTDMKFDYEIVATRKNYEKVRLQKYIEKEGSN